MPMKMARASFRTVNEYFALMDQGDARVESAAMMRRVLITLRARQFLPMPSALGICASALCR
jgi:hypothetical protein